ncbi:MAG: DUF2852 domain-containing protein [Hyphomicrobium sp.]|nr:DUF2852 domain-containing protein [Hyphomicrobium sp.]
MNEMVMKLDEWGKPAWIALMVAGFIIFWPLGLAVLAYLIWSGRMGCGWHGEKRDWSSRFADTWERRREEWRSEARSSGLHRGSSGNRAFDEYREETLKRLEEEQREFRDFLERLRLAKDRSEFDAFMADRKARAADSANKVPGSDDAGAQPAV